MRKSENMSGDDNNQSHGGMRNWESHAACFWSTCGMHHTTGDLTQDCWLDTSQHSEFCVEEVLLWPILYLPATKDFEKCKKGHLELKVRKDCKTGVEANAATATDATVTT